MLIAVIILAALLVLALLFFVLAYNRLVRLRNETENGWANIDVQLKRHIDLVPNLVETVKGYASHERETFQAVTEARAAANRAGGPREAAAADALLAGALGRLLAVAEAYPDLKASTNFLSLQEELADIEDRIAAARRYYNATVLRFNTSLQTFPTLVVGNVFRFQEAEFFAADEEERELPAVSFARG